MVSGFIQFYTVLYVFSLFHMVLYGFILLYNVLYFLQNTYYDTNTVFLTFCINSLCQYFWLVLVITNETLKRV